MSDHGHDYADGQLAAFEAEVADVYRQAERQARKDLTAFLEEFRERDDEKRAELEAGQISERAYAEWRRGMMMTGRRYQQVLDQVAEAYSNANEVAVAALNGRLPDVYAENANYGGWQVCEASGLDVSFSLMDASTAQHMLTAGEALIAPPALNVAKDLAWNRKLLASQLTQGVLLGESIPKLAKRVQRVTGSNYAAAVRTARTAVTGAENAGRVHSYGLARAMGIKLRKEWLATLDGRTRHTHRKLDKAKAPDPGTFDNGCRFPGDPQGPYSEICNCRCTLVPAIDGIDQDGAERWSRLPPGMTYEEWKAGGSGRKAAETLQASISGGQALSASAVRSVVGKAVSLGPSAGKTASSYIRLQGMGKRGAKLFEKAVSYVPTAMLETVKRGNVEAVRDMSLERSEFDPKANTLRIGRGADELTVVHELMHAVEEHDPGFLDAEREYFEKRTKGKKLVQLRKLMGDASYGIDEMAFDVGPLCLTPYAFKDYGGDGYELMSMGVELLYRSPSAYLRDIEMLKWVLSMMGRFGQR